MAVSRGWSGRPVGVPAAHAGIRQRVLVIEDHAEVRQMLAAVLTRAGWQVATSADGAEALVLARTQPFDLVLADVTLPGVSGPDAVRALTAEHGRIGVVYISGHADGLPAEHDGPAVFLQKPFTSAELAAAMQSALSAAAATVLVRAS